LGDELVLLDTSTDRVHQLNRTATFVWRECAVPTTAERIADAMADVFDVDQRRALQDVTAVLSQLCALNLVVAASTARAQGDVQ
jgi:2-keto-3-deoxy-L-rhamnonate aldolase RhmA